MFRKSLRNKNEFSKQSSPIVEFYYHFFIINNNLLLLFLLPKNNWRCLTARHLKNKSTLNSVLFILFSLFMHLEANKSRQCDLIIRLCRSTTRRDVIRTIHIISAFVR